MRGGSTSSSDLKPYSSDKLLRFATYASMATALVLIGVKLFGWLMTGSVSILASLVDSLMDAGASLVNLIAVRYSLRGADADHRFGHGKAESLAGLGQATFIAGSALFLLIESVDRLFHPRSLGNLQAGVVVIAFSILVTLALVSVQRYVIRRTQSVAIRADALHYVTDLLTGFSVILALGLVMGFGWNGADAWFAMAIAFYIFYSAWQIAQEALQILMDKELPEELRHRITRIATEHPQVYAVHELRTRSSGRDAIIQLHLDLDPEQTLREAHTIADEVEAAIRLDFPNSDIIIHQDPRDMKR